MIEPEINKADIFAFQEVTDETIEKYSLDFYEYDEYKTQSNKDQMHTYIKKTLNPQLEAYGQFQPGRPFLVNSFLLNGHKVLFINVHLGHKQRGVTTTIHNDDLTQLQNVVGTLSFDRVIIAGDFNHSPDKIVLKNQYGKTIEAKNIVKKSVRQTHNTCCNDFQKSGCLNKAGFIDNVLDSYYSSNDTVYQLHVVWNDKDATNPIKQLGSDHSPIIVTVPFKKTTAGGGKPNLKSTFMNEIDSYTYDTDAWKTIGNQFLALRNRRERTLGGRRKV